MTALRWYGYQDRATGELFAYSRRRLASLPKSVIVRRWRVLPPEITQPRLVAGGAGAALLVAGALAAPGPVAEPVPAVRARRSA